MYWLSNAKHNDVMFLQEKILMSYYTLIPGFFVFIHVYRNFNFKITHFVKTKKQMDDEFICEYAKRMKGLRYW